MSERVPKSRIQRALGRHERRDLEGPIHMACLNYLRLVLPGAEIHHSANELDLGGDRRSKAIAQRKAKEKGMQPGWPDLQVLWRGQFWCFEVKAPGNRPTKEQVARGEGIVANGGRWAVVYSVDDVQRCLSEWMAAADLTPPRRIPLRGAVS